MGKKDQTLFKKVFGMVFKYHYDKNLKQGDCPGDWDKDPMGFFEDLESTFGVSPEWDFNASIKEIQDWILEKWDGSITGLDDEGNWDAEMAH